MRDKPYWTKNLLYLVNLSCVAYLVNETKNLENCMSTEKYQNTFCCQGQRYSYLAINLSTLQTGLKLFSKMVIVCTLSPQPLSLLA